MIWFLSWLFSTHSKARKFEQLLKDKELAAKMLPKEKAQGFPWLAKAYDDHFHLQDLKLASYLEYKPHPARKSAEELRQIAKERREAEKAARLSAYLLDYCRYLAPWLDEYIGLDAGELDEIINEIHSAWEKKQEEFDEEVRRNYGPTYEKLTTSEKLQKKLDWYRGKPNKSKWQIGRDFERYVGYLYEIKGWNVYYHGKKGFEDLGRDLICKKGEAVEIIQCKRWAQEKTIHEKHIYYLFGTTVEYFIERFGDEHLQLALFPDLVRQRNVIPKLVTTIDVSDKAEQVAKVLGVVVEKVPSEPYPSVKCNVARRTSEKIFHLPFDQQYDSILVEEERLEHYVGTVAEAEALGFRHAYRWKGEG
ncbi:MAG: restriction endonuclease [Chloroflexi bacterium]|nr:restriction endonuclease [Chloroflexota bacterium]